MAASYEFDMHVNSTNGEEKFSTDNNQMHLSVGIWIDSTLELHGYGKYTYSSLSLRVLFFILQTLFTGLSFFNE